LTVIFSPCYKQSAEFGCCIPLLGVDEFLPSMLTKGNRSMNKTELIEQIANSADISKASAGRALDAAIVAVTTSLKKGQTVTLVGFGSFYVGNRAARSGRNPRTGDAIKIKAAKVPKFRAGKGLKDAVN
jgi:DNA-binding protein HU-beta